MISLAARLFRFVRAGNYKFSWMPRDFAFFLVAVAVMALNIIISLPP